MDLLTSMVEHHVWLTGEMIGCAKRLTDEQLDQPIELSVDDDPRTSGRRTSPTSARSWSWVASTTLSSTGYASRPRSSPTAA